ncbi:MAG: FkbM family methyltransferase [Nanoarchaeota archaeon]
MNLGHITFKIFEKFPEIPFKNKIRYFLAFNKLVPKFIYDLLPIKGYEMYYNLKLGDTVIDAGAFTGDYTVFAAKKVGNKGKVIAFEPDIKNRVILEKNISKEKLKNVIIIPKGLWDKNTVLFMDSLNVNSNVFDKEGSQPIEVVRLDDELKKLNLSKIDFIKMDIEGAEIEAVRGSINTIKKFKPAFAIASYHIIKNKTTSVFLEDFFSRIGYNVKSDFSKHLTTYAWKN